MYGIFSCMGSEFLKREIRVGLFLLNFQGKKHVSAHANFKGPT